MARVSKKGDWKQVAFKKRKFVARALKKKPSFVFVPKKLASAIILPQSAVFKALGKKPLVSVDYLDVLSTTRFCSSEKARKILKYRPKKRFSDAVKTVFEWF